MSDAGFRASGFSGHVPGSAGLYVHFPFCLKKCPYCNFYSVADISLKEEFIVALLKEIELCEERRLLFDSVYFGGGTPSLLSPEEISLLLERIRKRLFILQGVEITMEANPGAVIEKNFRGYLEAGINRINIGVQSFQDDNLRFLGRIHSSKQARDTLESARKAGFENIGIDLIYGLPGQRRKDWEKDLSQALSFNPEHLSCYLLTYEENAPMGEAVKRGAIVPLGERKVAGLFSFTLDFLSYRKYPPYEISNFARTDSVDPEKYRSRHNIKYWDFSPYLGLGPSAHSYLHPMRFWNTSLVPTYIENIKSRISPVEESEILTRDQQIIESVLLGLRTIDGVDLKNFKNRFDASFVDLFAKPLRRLLKEGFLNVSRSRCAPTLKGLRYHDAICGLMVQEIG